MTDLSALGNSREAKAIVLRADDTRYMSSMIRAVGVRIAVLDCCSGVVACKVVAEAEEAAGAEAGSDRGGEVEDWVEVLQFE